MTKAYGISYALIYRRYIRGGITATKARSNLYTLIDQTKNFHEPIVISGKRNNAVLISEDDWNSIQETLYLCSIPGMRESILEASKEPLNESVEDLGW